MGWKSGLAGLALACGVAGMSCAAEPGASYETFEGRDYLLLWPAQTPSTLLVYLHVADTSQPLAYEASSGMLEALAADSALRGYAVIAPTAAFNDCDQPDFASRYCWRVSDLDEELEHIGELVSFIQRNNEIQFSEFHAVGYGQGGDFLTAALAGEKLSAFSKVGFVDAGPPPAGASFAGAAPAGPFVYLEAAEGDQISAMRARDLLAALIDASYGAKVCARGDVGGAFYDNRRLAAFLNWFAQDCRVTQPSPTAAPDTPALIAPAIETMPAAPIAGVVEDDDDARGPAPAIRSGPPR